MPAPKLIRVPGHEPMSLTQIAATFGLPYTTVTNRWYKGLRGADLIAPLQRRRAPSHEPSVEVPGHGTMTLTQAAAHIGVTRQALLDRWDSGLRGADLVAPRYTHQRSKYLVHIDGHPPMTLSKASEMFGVPYHRLYARHNKGLRGDELLAGLYKARHSTRSKLRNYLEEVSAASGIPYRTLYSRFHRGLRGKFLLSGKTPNVQVVIGGQDPFTLREAAFRYALPYDRIVARACAGKRGEDLVAPLQETPAASHEA